MEMNINNENTFTIIAFTTSEYPITFEISHSNEDKENSHLVMKPNDCNYERNEGSLKVPCDHINEGWNKLNILVNRTTLVINDYINLPIENHLKAMTISGEFLVNCTKGIPIWMISKE